MKQENPCIQIDNSISRCSSDLDCKSLSTHSLTHSHTHRIWFWGYWQANLKASLMRDRGTWDGEEDGPVGHVEGEKGDWEDHPRVLVNIACPHPQDPLWRGLGWFILNIKNTWVLMLVKDANNLTRTTLEKGGGEWKHPASKKAKKGENVARLSFFLRLHNALWGRRCTAYYV